MKIFIFILSFSPLFLLLMSLYWTFFFIGRIIQFKIYLKAASRHISTTNKSGNMFEQAAYYYQTEIQKYFFLIVINFAEGCGFALNLFSQYLTVNYLIVPGIKGTTDMNCTHTDTSNELVMWTVINMVTTLQKITYLCNSLLLMSLMHYLTRRIKKIRFLYESSRPRCILVATVILSLLLIATIHINGVIFPVVNLIYLCIFLRSVKRFERTLLQRAGERMTQYGSNKVEIREYRNFKLTMRFICIGFSLIVVSDFLIEFPEFTMSIMAYLRCYFPLLQSSTVSSYFVIGKEVVSYWMLAGYALAYLGGISAFSPFVLITLNTWFILLYKAINRKSKYIYSYHIGGLTDSLLQ